jgi:hypothetical protein
MQQWIFISENGSWAFYTLETIDLLQVKVLPEPVDTFALPHQQADISLLFPF